jgi:hypothetical protein
MFLKATVLLLFVLFQLSSSGQTKTVYEVGIVELNNGETVIGHIKKEPLSEMVFSVSFKQDLTGKAPTVYDTAQIRRYWFGTKDAFELLRLPEANTTAPVRVFAKVMVKGYATLYKTAYRGEELYIIKRDSTLYVLQNNEALSRNTKTAGVNDHNKAQLVRALGEAVIANTTAGKLALSEKNFIEFVSAYNRSIGAPNEIMLAKENPVSFLLATVGGGLQGRSQKELFLHSAYRTYFPDLSSNASLNVGLNLYATKYSEMIKINFYDYEFKYTSVLVTIPVEVQYNLLKKAIRPFVSGGFSLCYLSVKDQYGNSNNEIFKNHIGIRPVYSGGVEADIAKDFLIKLAYRKEVYSHLALVGIGYKIF